MNRKIIVFVVGLLALGALEFGLLGASASGIVGGSGHELPPISQRQNVAFTATATPTITPIFVATATPPPPPSLGCAISPPNASPPCSALAASIELMRPDPAAISCDGISASVLRVFVRNILGNPVDDGTPVQFSVYNGSPSPYFALTKGGAAATAIVIYSDAYSYQPNVTVRSGDLETAIRIRCLPNSGCPLSPPPNASPPCGPTPVPCNPSPGAGVNSPPCAVVTPISPPICAPNQTSPPCIPLSPPPAPTTGIGGRIFIGTPELIGGRLRVPVNTTASTDPYSGFNAYLAWDGAIADPTDPTAERTAASVFGSAQIFCIPPKVPISGAINFACVTLDGSSTTSGGNLADFWLQPKAGSGCLHLHLLTYGPPDNGDPTNGTYTVDANAAAVQASAYGPDVYVNTADGKPCFSSPPPEPTFPPPPTGGIGGQIYIGTPELVGGKIRVPINTTQPQDPFSGFNVQLAYDASLAGFGPADEFSSGGVLESNGAGTYCIPIRTTQYAGGGCTILGGGAVSKAGTLAYVSLTPKASTGCLRLHIATLGPPDLGSVITATYTVDGALARAQSNTYGPDAYINIATGTECGSVASCIDFTSATCDLTPTPPGSDAQTATAIAGPPQATPTAVPTATQAPAPSPTRERERSTRTAEPSRTRQPRRTETPEHVACADVTGDGRVTGYDVAAIGAHIIGRYRAKYDLNHDGRVNMQDVRIAIRQLGRRC